MTPRKGSGQFARIVDALYAVEGKLTEPDYLEVLWQVAAHKRRSLVIIFTDVMDEINETLFASLAELRRRHLVLVLFVGDSDTVSLAETPPSDSEKLFRQATAIQVLADRGRTIAKLKKTGVLVSDVLPNQLTPALINKYLEIKKTGRL